MGQNLFLMSHPDVSLVNILLSITRVSLVQNKCVFCQLRVHFKSTINWPFVCMVDILEMSDIFQDISLRTRLAHQFVNISLLCNSFWGRIPHVQ